MKANLTSNLRRVHFELEEEIGKEITLAVIAQMLGISSSAVSKYFKKKALPPLDKAYILSKFYGKPLDVLFQGSFEIETHDFEGLDKLTNSENREIIEQIKTRLET